MTGIFRASKLFRRRGISTTGSYLAPFFHQRRA
jgi:hypothetical protein